MPKNIKRTKGASDKNLPSWWVANLHQYNLLEDHIVLLKALMKRLEVVSIDLEALVSMQILNIHYTKRIYKSNYRRTIPPSP